MARYSVKIKIEHELEYVVDTGNEEKASRIAIEEVEEALYDLAKLEGGTYTAEVTPVDDNYKDGKVDIYENEPIEEDYRPQEPEDLAD